MEPFNNGKASVRDRFPVFQTLTGSPVLLTFVWLLIRR